MRATGIGSAGSISALLLCLLASTSTAQDLSPQRAPAVRVYSQNGPGVASNYVTPAIEVSEAAYVFAVMMDVDGRIQVLYPEFPGISVRILSQNQLRLPNFFAGFNEPMQSARRYSANGLVTYDGNGTFGNDARGTVIALASRAPFRLSLLEANGDWNISAIRDLIQDRTPNAAARSLARYFGAKGEPIGSDYMRFAGGTQTYYAYDGYASCGYGGRRLAGGAFIDGRAFNRSAKQRSANGRPVVVGYDACGSPVVVAAPFTPRGRARDPVARRPKGDTPGFPKARFPTELGGHDGDGDNSAPIIRRAERRDIADQFRSESERSLFRERDQGSRERSGRPPAESAPIGVMPIHRAEPRVIWSSPQPRAQPAPQSRPQPPQNSRRR
jgi:hypothetical protein